MMRQIWFPQKGFEPTTYCTRVFCLTQYTILVISQGYCLFIFCFNNEHLKTNLIMNDPETRLKVRFLLVKPQYFFLFFDSLQKTWGWEMKGVNDAVADHILFNVRRNAIFPIFNLKLIQSETRKLSLKSNYE